MISTRQYQKLFPLILLIGIWFVACSTSYINVNYRLPSASESLKSRTVFIEFKDMRTEKAFLTKAAQKEFKHFTGIFSLKLAGAKKNNLGGHDANSLFKEAFKKRLNTLGIEVTPARGKNQPIMEIVLKEFLLDLKGRNWSISIVFETRLIKDQDNIATETVSATGERFKSLGRRDAEKVLGEIFSDSLNKIDIQKLFQKVAL
ncbi:hypothetical protein ACFL0M_00115 [Thermodesulfobacteriota bacterium]